MPVTVTLAGTSAGSPATVTASELVLHALAAGEPPLELQPARTKPNKPNTKHFFMAVIVLTTAALSKSQVGGKIQ